MATKSPLKVASQTASSAVSTARDWTHETMIAGRPVIWYVTGWRFAIITLIVGVLLPLVPYSAYPDIQSLLVALTSVFIYVMLALGLNVVVGYAGLLDLGYVAFYVIGAYTMASGTFGSLLNFNEKPFSIPTFPFALLLLAGALIAGIFGILLGAPTLRLRGDYLAIVTLGFGEIVPIVFQHIPTFYGSLGMTSTPPPPVNTPFGLLSFTDPLNNAPFYYMALLFAVLVAIGSFALRNSSIGRAWVAIREDETAAESSGVNLVRTKLLAYALGAFVGGVAGVMQAAFVPSVNPVNFQFQISITILAMVVLGGLGSIAGVILGAMILQFLYVYVLQRINDPIHASFLVASNGAPLHFLANVDFSSLNYLIFGILLVIMILLRPQGLIPDARRKRELKGEGAAQEGVSAIGLLEQEEAGIGIGAAADSLDETEYSGAGSDAQGREG
ncbi:MAG TPA: branched-chain amino acid ABC transporter permease [Ktedonobacterales bacterium]|jgi:ABC-type branched-subunit amino acid transport system permease subunit|nr:branched-chain amino acid ABC transporter permease [Ktedonobacterales bacterium]